MYWKDHLKKLETEERWEEAIKYMQQVVKEKPNDMDAYLSINYLIIDFLVEIGCPPLQEKYYMALAKYYFDESYSKFSQNPEYLYITGRTAVMAEFIWGIDSKDYEEMFKKAREMEPGNLLYKEDYYWALAKKNRFDPELIAYAKMILSSNSPIKKQLISKGSVGEYILGMKEGWALGILSNASELASKQEIN